MKLIKLFKQLSIYFKKDKFKLILFCILTFIYIFRGLLNPFLWGLALEAISVKNWSLFLEYFILVQGAALFFMIAIDFPRNLLHNKLELNFMSTVSRDLFEKTLKLPVVAYEDHGVGEFINRIYTDPDRIIELLSRIINLLARLVSLIFVIFYSIRISLLVTLELVIFGIVTFILSKYFYPRIKESSKIIKERGDEYVKEATQSLTGIREIKGLGIRKSVQKFTFQNINLWFEEQKRIKNLELAYYIGIDSIYIIMEFAILLTCGYLFFQGHIAFAIFILIESYIWRVYDAVEEFSKLGVNYNKIVASLKRISEILNNELYQDAMFGSKHIRYVTGNIEFKNVYFAYPNEGDTLKGLNLKINTNKKIAIVGKSGMGKSTLFNLLLRFFEIKKGEILIDDENLKNFSEESLKKHISIIRQDPYLFNKTIKENFLIVRSDITNKEIKELCKKAYIDEYIMSLPKKYDSIIGENGVNLSGGQKQRLAIARALAKGSKILLFDEATSALDNESQEHVKTAIDNLAKDHTIVIIAHRLSTIMDADEIILIDKGKVAAKGTHEELLKTSKVYKTLYNPELTNVE